MLARLPVGQVATGSISHRGATETKKISNFGAQVDHYEKLCTRRKVKIK